MTNNDLKQIGNLIDQRLDQKFKIFGNAFDKKLAGTEARLREEITGTEARLREEITGTEARLREEITGTEARLREEIVTSKKEVTDNVSDFVENTLLPMINERFDTIDEELEEKADKADIDRIERKLDRLTSTDLDHEKRIKDIESVPVVAHELKHRKSK